MDIPTLEILAKSELPYVAADEHGHVVAINTHFTRVYGWEENDIIGKSLSCILPESFRMSHQLGFSRYICTKSPTVLGHPLKLMTIHKNGDKIFSEHFIVAENKNTGTEFGATLRPL